jgi:hypothetical protein
MNATFLINQHCPDIAALWRHDSGAISFGFMVKYDPNTGLEVRLQEVRE